MMPIGPHTGNTTRFTRRHVLLVGAMMATASATWPNTGRAAQADEEPVTSFVSATRLLTGRSPVTPEAALRAWGQLVSLDQTMPTQVARLMQAIRAAEITDIETFLASPLGGDPSLRKTATVIVSAWYLGYTGTPIPLRAADDTGFVTYRGALMFAPTADATVIPTYARAGAGYWIDPPPGTPRPPGAAGVRDWPGEGAVNLPPNARL